MLDGIKEQPQFQKYMAFHMFNIIRSLFRYCKAEILKICLDPWAWFRNSVDDFNTNHSDVLHQGVHQTMDESMSAYKHRKDKLGGLPKITYIHCDPKPTCDGAEDHVRLCYRRDGLYGGARGEERHACKKTAEHGMSIACVRRMAGYASNEGMTVLGDAWFGSIKVRKA
jgi:hypothetical protein